MSGINGNLIEGAADEARASDRLVEATALDAISILFNKEVLRCLDPRHSTTLEQADAAVAEAWPFDKVIEAITS